MNRIHHADNKKDSAVPVLLSFSYSYVLLFTISVQAAGLVIPYVLGLSLHYKWLVLTYEKCTVSCMHIDGLPIFYKYFPL